MLCAKSVISDICKSVVSLFTSVLNILALESIPIANRPGIFPFFFECLFRRHHHCDVTL